MATFHQSLKWFCRYYSSVLPSESSTSTDHQRAVERPLVQVRVVVAQGVGETAAVDVVVEPGGKQLHLVVSGQRSRMLLPISVVAVCFLVVVGVALSHVLGVLGLLVDCLVPLVHLDGITWLKHRNIRGKLWTVLK